jgi:hypothetical protein
MLVAAFNVVEAQELIPWLTTALAFISIVFKNLCSYPTEIFCIIVWMAFTKASTLGY